MSSYKSRYTGAQIDSTLDAVNALSPSIVKQTPDDKGRYNFEIGKTYLIQNSNATKDWGVNITANSIITAAGFEESRHIAYLPKPAYDKYSDGLKLRLLGFDVSKEVDSAGYVYSINIVYEIAPSNLLATAQRNLVYAVEPFVAEDIPDILNYLDYEFYVDGATDVFVYNDNAQITANDGNSVFIRYSMYEDGEDFQETPDASRCYIGFAVAATAPENKEAYRWSRYVDEIGEVGAALDAIIDLQESLIGGDDV